MRVNERIQKKICFVDHEGYMHVLIVTKTYFIMTHSFPILAQTYKSCLFNLFHFLYLIYHQYYSILHCKSKLLSFLFPPMTPQLLSHYLILVL